MTGTAFHSALPGSPLEYQEDDGRLILRFPATPGRGLKRVAGPVLFGIVIGLAPFLNGATLSFAWPFLVFVGLVLAVYIWICFVGSHLTSWKVDLTADSVLLTTRVFGRDETERHTLTAQSRARSLQSRGRSAKPGSSKMRWIEIKTAGGEARFGYGLDREERDWVERSVNEFLDRTDM
jgi:hypothetical protein